MKIEIEEKKLDMIYRRQNLEIACFLRKGNEKNILFLHGLGCSKEDFRGAAQFQGLRDYTLLAFDFPGCGGSSYPEKMELGMDDLVEITHMLVSQLDMGKCILVGHSMGGLVALLYSEKYNRDVTAFINVEGNLTGKDCFISRKMIRYDFSEFRDAVFPQFAQKMLKSDNIGFKRYGEILQQHSSPRAFYDYCPSLVLYSDEGELIQRFLKLKVPKLFIYGSENYSLPYIPGLRKGDCNVVEIPKSNHCPNYDNPEEFYQVIANFIKSK
jgi:pimeloyl-ACP methyl ester carboxylesterase